MNLHQKFRQLAFDINKVKNRLMMLLLDIYKEEIYKNYGCATIYEYGFKYARLSKETVQLALRTLINTEDKPLLRAKIATQGIYKVSMVAKIATPETDKVFAEHVENMPKPVLLEFAKELRSANLEYENRSENELRGDFGSCKYRDDLDDSIKCKAVTQKITIELDEEMQIIFNQLKKKCGKELSNKEALKAILKEANE